MVCLEYVKGTDLGLVEYNNLDSYKIILLFFLLCMYILYMYKFFLNKVIENDFYQNAEIFIFSLVSYWLQINLTTLMYF